MIKLTIDLLTKIKILLLVLIVIAVTFASCLGWNGDEPIITERDKCEALAKHRNSQLDPEGCSVLLPLSSGSQNSSMFNLILLGCLAYQVDMKECKKKSDILPSGSSR
jgi:hypothetical protein